MIYYMQYFSSAWEQRHEHCFTTETFWQVRIDICSTHALGEAVHSSRWGLGESWKSGLGADFVWSSNRADIDLGKTSVCLTSVSTILGTRDCAKFCKEEVFGKFKPSLAVPLHKLIEEDKCLEKTKTGKDCSENYLIRKFQEIRRRLQMYLERRSHELPTEVVPGLKICMQQNNPHFNSKNIWNQKGL